MPIKIPTLAAPQKSANAEKSAKSLSLHYNILQLRETVHCTKVKLVHSFFFQKSFFFPVSHVRVSRDLECFDMYRTGEKIVFSLEKFKGLKCS